MYTEDEAKEKWCHQAMVKSNRRATSSNRDSNGSFDDTHCCMASECMAWRIQEHMENPTHSGGMTHYEIKHTGYCGLAGKP